ncbi:hypothetical protein Tco_1387253, partial [Tanacetum coccineum]
SALPNLSTSEIHISEPVQSSSAEAVLGNTITAFSSLTLNSLVRTSTSDSQIVVPISDEVAMHALQLSKLFRHSENWRALKIGPQIVSHKQSKHQRSDPHDTIADSGHSKSNHLDTLTTSFHLSSNPDFFLSYLSVSPTGMTSTATMSTST